MQTLCADYQKAARLQTLDDFMDALEAKRQSRREEITETNRLVDEILGIKSYTPRPYEGRKPR